MRQPRRLLTYDCAGSPGEAVAVLGGVERGGAVDFQHRIATAGQARVLLAGAERASEGELSADPGRTGRTGRSRVLVVRGQFGGLGGAFPRPTPAFLAVASGPGVRQADDLPGLSAPDLAERYLAPVF